MKRVAIIITSIIILILIIILIDVNMTYKTPNTEDHIPNSSSLLIDIIKTSSCESAITKVSFILFKQEQILEMWLHADTCYQLIETYPISINNISSGPKLYNEQFTIPEGIYQFEFPLDSSNIIINYPNQYDITKAHADNRPTLSTIISFKSTNEKNTITLKENDLKDLYDFLSEFKLDNVSLIIVPSDIRKFGQFPNCSNCPHWIFELYGQLKLSILPFKE